MKNKSSIGNENRIHLVNIQLAIFDFDDTLALHKDPAYSYDKKPDYYIQAYSSPEIFYETIEPCDVNNEIKKVIIRCRDNGIPMFCCSAMKFSLHAKTKQNFINNHYGNDIGFIIASTQENKDDVLETMAKAKRIERSRILFIDDDMENIKRIREKGFSAIHVSEVSTIET